MDNLFFDLSKLKYCGKNVIIGKTARIRYPEIATIGDNCIIDDFTYISTALELTNYVHISCGCRIIGGRSARVTFEDFSTLSPNVVVVAGSDDYIGGIATPLVPFEYKGNVDIGDIIISRHCIVGSNSVILPNVVLAEGASVGALSLVNKNLDPWTLYAGIPVRKVKNRDREKILSLEKEFKKING